MHPSQDMNRVPARTAKTIKVRVILTEFRAQSRRNFTKIRPLQSPLNIVPKRVVAGTEA